MTEPKTFRMMDGAFVPLTREAIEKWWSVRITEWLFSVGALPLPRRRHRRRSASKHVGAKALGWG